VCWWCLWCKQDNALFDLYAVVALANVDCVCGAYQLLSLWRLRRGEGKHGWGERGGGVTIKIDCEQHSVSDSCWRMLMQLAELGLTRFISDSAVSDAFVDGPYLELLSLWRLRSGGRADLLPLCLCAIHMILILLRLTIIIVCHFDAPQTIEGWNIYICSSPT
jgi:hypothetical protein